MRPAIRGRNPAAFSLSLAVLGGMARLGLGQPGWASAITGHVPMMAAGTEAAPRRPWRAVDQGAAAGDSRGGCEGLSAAATPPTAHCSVALRIARHGGRGGVDRLPRVPRIPATAQATAHPHAA
ncbi:hypothetical protein CKO45_00380 [Paracraurococcus ruber]|uniref:Uncharacterized protein n=1 Tax=Paracraurococcus ruber TaxID=77675 RepID=A0ABS1CQI2_9PROT|nr:hypothetical protein [Paracraurococcus ruber]